MKLKKVFFSYSRADFSAFVLNLALDLKKQDFDVWIDQEDIRAGSEWDLEIEKALETCDCLLFIQSKNSVVSTNVLDEVYYALEQHKRVIPILMEISKTPFRIKRLNYIDFTKNYLSGLTNLTNELNGDYIPELSQLKNEQVTRKPPGPFTRPARLVLISSILLIIAVAAVIYFMNNKKQLNNTTNQTVSLQDSSVREEIPVTEFKDTVAKSSPVQKEKAKNKIKTPQNRKEPAMPIEKPLALNATLAGEWDLVDVEPKARLKRGTLKIEETSDNKFNVKSALQFYYFKGNDTLFLSVFNGFAGCTSCLLQPDMKLIPEDIALGSQHYQILKEPGPGGEKVGDTLMSAGGNNSIRASVTLHFTNNTTALIKVQRTTPVLLPSGLVIAPFTYTFRFTKTD